MARPRKVPTPATTGDTLTVANKLPHNLALRLHRFEEQNEITPGGTTRSVKVAIPVDHPDVVIKGNAFHENLGPRQQIVGGYALTHGVPADVFHEWLAQNRDSEVVRKNLVFAADRSSYAEGKAKEHASLRTGFERLDGNHLDKHGIFGVEKVER